MNWIALYAECIVNLTENVNLVFENIYYVRLQLFFKWHSTVKSLTMLITRAFKEFNGLDLFVT